MYDYLSIYERETKEYFRVCAHREENVETRSLKSETRNKGKRRVNSSDINAFDSDF